MTVLVTPAPDRSLQQRMDALAYANRVRVARAQMRRDLKAGRLDPCEVLTAVPWYAETMKVGLFLHSLPKVGEWKRDKILRKHRISPSKTLLGLSRRQRMELGAELIARDL